MNILHITTRDSGGAGLCCLRIHSALLDQGINSRVLTLKNTRHVQGVFCYGNIKFLIWRIFSEGLSLLGIKLTLRAKCLDLSKKYKAAYSLPISPIDLTRSELIEWADIIHLHWVNNYLDYQSFLKKVKKPIVWTLHDESFFYGIAHLHKNILADNYLEKKCRKIKFDAVQSAENLSIVFLSQMMFNTFKDEKIIEGRRKTVICNAVDTNIFTPQDKNQVRKKYGIDCTKRVFVFISINIADPNKGLQELSEALYSIDPDAEIIAIGANPWGKQWNNVRPIGLVNSQKEMCELISCADYMAMPSYQEAFSQSPMEAMACGLPVVVFPVSGTSELVNDNNGVICDDFTIESLKKGIETLFSRKYNAADIRQYMIDCFSPSIISERYIELYNNILNNCDYENSSSNAH